MEKSLTLIVLILCLIVTGCNDSNSDDDLMALVEQMQSQTSETQSDEVVENDVEDIPEEPIEDPEDPGDEPEEPEEIILPDISGNWNFYEIPINLFNPNDNSLDLDIIASKIYWAKIELIEGQGDADDQYSFDITIGNSASGFKDKVLLEYSPNLSAFSYTDGINGIGFSLEELNGEESLVGLVTIGEQDSSDISEIYGLIGRYSLIN